MFDGVPPKSKTRTLKVADLFCGAGGSSTGAQRALRRLGYETDLLCVNHWPVAIETHRRNHPEARHYCQDIDTVRPHLVVPEGRLDLLMASPTCTHHSRARGGKPTSDQQRMDPWHVITWLTELRVRCLIIENVPEFIRWGPVDARSGRPVKSRDGEYFLRWVETIRGLGFRVDWRVLNAADYGDATTRERFFLIARSDKKPLRWPEPTHGREPGTGDLLGGPLQRWRAARDIIDWSIRGKSIFGRKVPLKPKTMARIYAGAVKLGWPEVFLVVLRQHMDGQSIDGPLPAITAGGTHIGLAQTFILSRQGGGSARSVDEPTPCQVAKHSHVLIAPYYGSGSGETCRSVDEPLPTCTTKARFGMVMPITHACGGNRARDAETDPLPTITTANRGELAFIAAAFGERPGQQPRVHSLDAPCPTICADGRVQLVEPDLDHIDILFRMLEPHELAAAMGFSGQEVSYEFVGTKTDAIRQIGNAVPVNTAAALVGALMSDSSSDLRRVRAGGER